MHPHGFRDLITDRECGIEASGGLLKDHADPPTPYAPPVRFIQLCQFLTGKRNSARRPAAAERINEAAYGKGSDRFPRAGLANESKCFAGPNAKGHIVDHSHPPLAVTKLDTQASNAQDRRIGIQPLGAPS
jgi:hypothetical protein